ncbi:glycosyltransferase [Oenococcus oeni]|nr:glycosyltransferase family 2 protein [Oenococcus oeni]
MVNMLTNDDPMAVSRKSPIISMAVVLYDNSTELIDNLISNLFSATSSFINVHLFLINNSPQNSALSVFLRNKEKIDIRIKVIEPKHNLGFGSGNNLVIPFLTSDYHFIINPDVIIADNLQIPKITNYLDHNLEVGLLSPLIKFPDGQVQHLLKKDPTVFDMFLRFLGIPIFKTRQKQFVNLPDGYDHVHYAENVPGSFMVFRTSIFKRIGGFDEKYFLYMEDSDITRAVNKISETVFFPDAFIFHKWQRENKKTFKGIIEMLRSMIIYFDKWGWRIL